MVSSVVFQVLHWEYGLISDTSPAELSVRPARLVSGQSIPGFSSLSLMLVVTSKPFRLAVGPFDPWFCKFVADVGSRADSEVRRDTAAALLPRLFWKNPRSHHKGATGRVRTGDQRLPVLCHCQLGQDIPSN